jgi:ATP-dependent DNA helicase DinG
MDIEQIAKKLSGAGLKHRESQLNMIQEAYNALHHAQILCLEAPTGTGKTISYGIAAYLAKTDKQTVVISTATVALQEQLYQKDLPLLSKVLGVTIRGALAKGRRRYVCHARLFDDDAQIDIFSRDDFRQQLRTRLENGSWEGDRDQLEVFVADAQWAEISTDSVGCSGKLCSYYNQCAFYKARQKWQQADFVITNHSLLLSDLGLGGGALLPSLDQSVYILDECHHFPEKALDHFAQSAPLLASIDWINAFNSAINKAVQNDVLNASRQKLLQENSHQLVNTLQQLQQFLEHNPNLFTQDFNKEWIWRCPENQTEVFTLAQPAQHASAKFSNECNQLLSEFEEKLKLTVNEADKQRFTKLIAQFGFFYNRADNLCQTFQLFCQSRQPQEPPLARWFVKNTRGQYECHVAPLNVSRQLKNLFWDQLTAGALLCSATVRALGDFSDFRRKTGLHQHPKLTEVGLETCFDYSKSVLFVPTMRIEPQGGEQSQHWEEVIELLPELILPRGGTLTLFTSKAAMEKTFARMPALLQTDILMQGALGKAALLTAHKDKVNAGGRSILFGLASFGEGLDLPAELCQHVIIHKLPFAVPTTPVELTRNEWLAQNRRNPFELATLPATSIRLAQYVGRLIRQETDIGVVTILDKRLYSKPYGAKLLKNLPAFQPLLNCSLQTLKQTHSVAHLFNTTV